jgi:8-oxo-dGTP diphosphatase
MSDKIFPPTHKIGAFAIIEDNEGRLLVSRRPDNGYYNLPGGGVESHESPQAGLVREVREETGLEVKIKRLIGVYSKTHVHEIVFSFEAQVIGGTLQLSNEADQHLWLAPEELDGINILTRHLERIQDFLLGEVLVILK